MDRRPPTSLPSENALEQIRSELEEVIVKLGGSRPSYAVLTEDGVVMPCDLLTWAKFLDGNPQRVILQEDLAGGYWISTVFLGLDHNHNLEGPQLWFETIIFGPPTGIPNPITGRVSDHDGEIFMDRYETLTEALAGHLEAKCRFEGGQ